MLYTDGCVLTMRGCYLWMNFCRERFLATLTLLASFRVKMGNMRVAGRVLEEEPKVMSLGNMIKVCSIF